MKKQYIGGDCLKRRGGLGQFVDLSRGAWQERGVVFLTGAIHTPIPTMIILSHLELSRIYLPTLNSSILMEIVTIPVGQVDEFYFYMHYPIKAWLFKLDYLFHIVLKTLVSY